MTANLMNHEKESAEMANKLSAMKTQIMTAESEIGLTKKYSGVRIGKISDTACTVSNKDVLTCFIDVFHSG